MVALCITLVTIVSNSEEVLIGLALVALILTTPQLVIFRVESELTALDYLVGILHRLLQLGLILGKGRVSLR